MTEKRYSHDGVTIIDHLKKDLIYIDGKENLLELAEYVDRLQKENEQLKQQIGNLEHARDFCAECCERLEEENEQLKSTIAQLIERNRKNNDLLLSDIRILEKALWCNGCENDYGRLKELRKEFMR